MIDPDGEGGVDPFLVYCDMDTDPSTGITVIKHNNDVRIPLDLAKSMVVVIMVVKAWSSNQSVVHFTTVNTMKTKVKQKH